MPLPNAGELSLKQIADEFGLRPPINASDLYLGSDPTNAVVLSNGGSNDAVPSAGPLGFAAFRSAACPKTSNNVLLTFQADFSALSANSALMVQFQDEVKTIVAVAAGVPLASVSVVSVTAGSVKVTVKVDYPVRNRATNATLQKLATLVAAPNAAFDAGFNSRYAISGQMVVYDATPPLLLSAAKALPNVAGSTASVSVADLFAAASNTGAALTYAIASTTSPAPSSLSLDSNAGSLSVLGRYRNQSYTVDVRAMSSNGVPSSNAIVTVTELDAPVTRWSNALGAAAPSNSTALLYSLSNHFAAAAADTLPLYFWLAENPRSNASVNGQGVLSVPGNYRNATYSVVLAASNAYGKPTASNQTLAVTEPDAPAPTVASNLGAVSMSNETKAYGLSNYFSTQADTLPLYYYVASNPQGSASVTGGVLSVAGNNRGLPYNVSVGASNAYGKQITQQLAVSEASATVSPTPPVTSGMVGYYTGESWTGTQWTDLSGANNHATIVGGTINTATYPSTTKTYLYGNTAASIQFPAAILPSTFTAFYVAKYNGTSKKRIIASLSTPGGTNWLSGFYNGYTGIAYRTTTFITGTTNNAVTGNTWLQITDQNLMLRAAKTNYTTNPSSSGQTYASPLAINKYTGEASDWAVAQVLVFNRTLTSTEYLQVESWISTIYTNV